MARSVHFVLEGPPVPTPRPRVVAGHAFVGSAEWKRYKRALTEAALEAFARLTDEWPTDQGYELELTVASPDARRRDLENIAKAPADALNRLAYEDDSQIDRLIVHRLVDRERPRTELRLTVIGPSVLRASKKR
jgi:Holliday junction resolvase RusA-like endonuclease